MYVPPVLGWRSWAWNGRLVGWHNQAWPSSTLCAQCSRKKYKSHNAPQQNCSCGIYAHNDFATAYRHIGLFGLVSNRKNRLLLSVGCSFVLCLFLAFLAWPALRYIGRDYLDWEGLLLAWPIMASMIYWRINCVELLNSLCENDVVGAVAMTGKVLVYRDGLRAEKARIICLLIVNKKADVSRTWLEHIYKVPVFISGEETKAQQYASEHGDSIQRS